MSPRWWSRPWSPQLRKNQRERPPGVSVPVSTVGLGAALRWLAAGEEGQVSRAGAPGGRGAPRRRWCNRERQARGRRQSSAHGTLRRPPEPSVPSGLPRDPSDAIVPQSPAVLGAATLPHGPARTWQFAPSRWAPRHEAWSPTLPGRTGSATDRQGPVPVPPGARPSVSPPPSQRWRGGRFATPFSDGSVWGQGGFGYSGTEVPTYAYRCDSGHDFEVVQPITAAPLTSCSVCAAPVHRVVFPVGIVFKGQGFYKTDSRSSSSGLIGPASSASNNGAAVKPAEPSEAAKPATQSEGDTTKSSKETQPSVPTTTGGAAAGGGKNG